MQKEFKELKQKASFPVAFLVAPKMRFEVYHENLQSLEIPGTPMGQGKKMLICCGKRKVSER